MWDKWVVDVSLWRPGDRDLLCFIPMEGTWDNPTFVVGMNFLSSPEGFDQGEIVAIVHEDGQDAVMRWCEENPDLLERLKDKSLHKEVRDVET